MHKHVPFLAPRHAWRLASLGLFLALAGCGGGSGNTGSATGGNPAPVVTTPDTPSNPSSPDDKAVIRCAP